MVEFLTKTRFNYFSFTENVYSNLYENIQVIAYSLICFFTPFFLSHPQFLVGSVVNMMLILGAQNLKGYKLFGMIFTPSLGVFAAGIIFSGLTKYLLFFMPMIWISNAILVYGYKLFRNYSKLSITKSISLAILFKVAMLSFTALILISLEIVPDIFMSVMSVFQLMTAVIGAISALSVTKFVLSKIGN